MLINDQQQASSTMRLIDTKTGKFVDFVDSSTAPLYAILSHTWARAPKREQSYQEVVKIQEKFGLSVCATEVIIL